MEFSVGIRVRTLYFSNRPNPNAFRHIRFWIDSDATTIADSTEAGDQAAVSSRAQLAPTSSLQISCLDPAVAGVARYGL